MDILYLLIPFSVAMIFIIIAVFAWALERGQFDDLEQQGASILDAEPASIDPHQGS